VWVEGRFIPAIGGGTGVEIALIAVAVVGAAVSAYGAYSAAEAQQEQLKTQKKINEADAMMADQAGREAAARQRKKDSYRLNSFRAKAAASGVVAGEGSSLLAELDFAEQGELAALDAQHGYQVESNRLRAGGSFAQWQANRISPTAAAGTSLISSAGSIAGSYGTTGAGTTAVKPQTGGGLTSSQWSAN
jgi:hypothetical protein